MAQRLVDWRLAINSMWLASAGTEVVAAAVAVVAAGGYRH